MSLLHLRFLISPFDLGKGLRTNVFEEDKDDVNTHNTDRKTQSQKPDCNIPDT